jgi:hypothetical protein
MNDFAITIPKYHKIHGLFKRYDNGVFNEEQFSLPEFEYLFDKQWIVREKIDGMNIRIFWDGHGGVFFHGRTNKAKIPEPLFDRLKTIFLKSELREIFGSTQATLFGEGYGKKIQKSGSLYEQSIDNEFGVDFILFDVLIDNIWLLSNDVNDIAKEFNIQSAARKMNIYSTLKVLYDRMKALSEISKRAGIPKVGKLVQCDKEVLNYEIPLDLDPFLSNRAIGQNGEKYFPEGYVLIPQYDLKTRLGKRIITKLKFDDFYK